MTVIVRYVDFLLSGNREDCSIRAEVHANPTLASAARQHDLGLGDRRPCVSDLFRRDDARFGRREITGGGRVKRPDYLGPPDCPNCSERSKEHNSYYERPRYARDAPQVLEEGETRDGERREGRREEGAGRKETDARRARGKGQAGGTGGQAA